MRTSASLVISLLLLWLGLGTGLCGNNSDLLPIRRAFICELGIPPSVAEIEWLLTYQTNTLESGIQYVLNSKYGTEESKHKTFLFNFYANPDNKKYQLFLTQSQQHTIVKYQTGNLNSSLETAKTILAQCALLSAENSEDPIDYLFVSLCGRYTNTQEYDFFNKILKNGKGSELDNMNLVLNAIVDSKYFINY